MLQVALGGYYLISTATSQLDDNPVYYEPGFNWMYPLERDVPLCDQIYMLIRKRSNAGGTTFYSLSATNFDITVTDVSNNESIPSSIHTNSMHSHWNSTSPSYTPLVASIINSISLTDEITRVRVMDCYIKDKTDNDFISFRLSVSDANKYFSYIPVATGDMYDRHVYSAFGRSSLVKMDNSSDYYILVSPYAYIQEVSSSDKYDFSYPVECVYYKRQKTYNDEDFDFSLGVTSNDFLSDNISIMNIPGYEKVCVVHIDCYVYKKLQEIGDTAYFYVNIVGRLSEISDSFQIVLSR
jgi:hypothetical protein